MARKSSFNSPADARAPRHRHGVPGAQPVRQSVGRREHLRHARDHPRPARHRPQGAGRKSQRSFSTGCDAGIAADTLVEDLPIGQQQLVEIAKAVSLDARILIMDEPTSALSRRRGRDPVQGHRRSEGAGRGDRLHLAPARRADAHRRLHHRAARRPDHRPGEVPRYRHAMDRPLDDRLGRQGFRQVASITNWARKSSAPRISACHAGPAALPSIMSHCRCRPGEILGIYGLMGAGRSELFECIIGRHAHSTGKIFVDGKEVVASGHDRRASARAWP